MELIVAHTGKFIYLHPLDEVGHYISHKKHSILIMSIQKVGITFAVV
jgi:hypothetical protein